ncbi:hypothetical protein [Streptomyces sp. SCSIO 30461]|uniref:hypothetical protein n=1 Tax=Streptomyces sp. SCSIO 30461 TaxID=3118085 RepID=UPI00387E833F
MRAPTALAVRVQGDAAQVLLPLVQDTNRFFGTEILVLAERAGLRIHEVPVDWIDDYRPLPHYYAEAASPCGDAQHGRADDAADTSWNATVRPRPDDHTARNPR